jgi:hypothetical protein
MLSIRLREGPWLLQSRVEDVPRVHDPASDDITSVLHDICECLADEGASLDVGGFGQDHWPLDVRTDLLTLLEQFPEVMAAVRNARQEFSIDFYEQGVQRRIDFHRRGNDVVARCISSTSWVPNPAVEVISAEDLRLMLTSLARDLLRIARICCAGHVSHPLFQDWARSLQVDSDQ